MARARSETRRGSTALYGRRVGGPRAATMTPFFLSIFPALFRLGDLSKAISQWISKAERAKRWASERAAIKAEVTQAKETVDLLRMARAITRLDALDAEIDAVRGKPNRRKVPRLREKPPSGRLL